MGFGDTIASSRLNQQGHCVGRDALFSSNGAKLFVGGGFDADLVGGEGKNGSEAIAHRFDMRLQFGSFCHNDRINVANLPTL